MLWVHWTEVNSVQRATVADVRQISTTTMKRICVIPRQCIININSKKHIPCTLGSKVSHFIIYFRMQTLPSTYRRHVLYIDTEVMCEILTSALCSSRMHRPLTNVLHFTRFLLVLSRSPSQLYILPGHFLSSCSWGDLVSFFLVLLKGLLGDVCGGLSEAVTDPTPLSLSDSLFLGGVVNPPPNPKPGGQGNCFVCLLSLDPSG